MKIEALHDIKSDGLVLAVGDVVTVTDDIGVKFCHYGWAKDVAGVVPTNEPIILNANLVVAPAIHGHSTENVNG